MTLRRNDGQNKLWETHSEPASGAADTPTRSGTTSTSRMENRYPNGSN